MILEPIFTIKVCADNSIRCNVMLLKYALTVATHVLVDDVHTGFCTVP